MKKMISKIITAAMLASSVAGVCGINAMATGADAHWIESNSYTSIDTGKGFQSVPDAAVRTGLSAGNGMRIQSGTYTGIGINYSFEVNTAQSYDIFVHGTYEANPRNTSVVDMLVDGSSCTITNLGSEGWIINSTQQIGWQKVTATLSSGSHTFRWQLDGLGSNATTNKALLDAIVIVPTAAGFVPTPLVGEVFQMQNNADYELCTLLMGQDLSSVASDLVLPASTAGNYAVTWTTSNASVITNAGVITQTSEDQSATLTASITVDEVEYTKDFVVTVAAASLIPGADQHWIESEDYSAVDAGKGFGGITGNSSLSATNARRVQSGTYTGIGMDYTFAVDTAQSYDIFVHGTYEENSEWMSTISMSIDGASKTVTNLFSEGWIISSNGYQVGWQKVTASLTRGSHTFRWQVDGKGSRASANKALLDAIVILPTSAGYEPTEMTVDDYVGTFPMQNKADYELCTLLLDEDLSSVTSALTLPSATVDDYAVTWTTSNASVITAAGVPTQIDGTRTATLTASINIDGTPYTKDFTVTVPGTGVETVIGTSVISGINDDGVTYRVGITFDELNPTDYEYIVFQAGTGAEAVQKGGTVADVLGGSYDGDVIVAIILDHSPSRTVAVQFTNETVSFID